MSGTAATWLQSLDSQPWYQSVSTIFAQAPDVPKEVWLGTLAVEDNSLDPTAQDYLHSGHYGLFQENANFPTTVGLPAATPAQLQSPTYNAQVAALAMEVAIKNSGATTTQGYVQALENAGWPGTNASADETAKRVAAIDAIYAAEGTAPPDGSTTATGATSSTGNAAIDAILGPNAGNELKEFAVGFVVVGVIGAVIAGGFLLLGNSVGAKPPAVVPV